MSQKRLEWKVGLFVFVCLALVAMLLIRFSKGTTFGFRKTYQITLNTANVGGLRTRASVLLSGVQIGTVSTIKLSPSGTNVVITLNIYKEYTILDDARFVIEQSGFLGDQFVAIYPDNNQGKPLKPGAESRIKEPFNLQEVARAAEGFIQRIDETASNLNDAITDVRGRLLNKRTLDNLSHGIDSFQKAADDAALVVTNINALILSNAVPAGAAVSNLYSFSDRLNAMALSAQSIVDSNRTQINITVSNLQASSVALTNLLNEANSGKGLLGLLLKNDQLATNITALASNLNAYSGYMRSNSLWHTLFHAPPTNAPPATSSKPKK